MPQPKYVGPIFEFATLRVYHTVGEHPDSFIFHNLTSSWEPQKLEPQEGSWVKEEFNLKSVLAKLGLEGWQIVHVKEWQPHPSEDIVEVWLQRVVRFEALGSVPTQRQRRNRKPKES